MEPNISIQSALAAGHQHDNTHRPPQNISTPTPSESLPQRNFRVTTGALTSILAGISCIMCSVAWLLPIFGGMALIAGSSNASDAQVANGFAMIFLMTASPYLWTVLLLTACIFIFRRKKPVVIYITCGLSLAIYITLAVFTLRSTWNELTITGAVIAAVPALIMTSGIVVAYRMREIRNTTS